MAFFLASAFLALHTGLHAPPHALQYTSDSCADNSSWVGVLTGHPDATPILHNCESWAGVPCDDAGVQEVCHATAHDAAEVQSHCPRTCNMCGGEERDTADVSSSDPPASCPLRLPAIGQPLQPVALDCDTIEGRNATLSARVPGYRNAFRASMPEWTLFRCPAFGVLGHRQAALTALVRKHCEAVRNGEAGSPISFEELDNMRNANGDNWPTALMFQHNVSRLPAAEFLGEHHSNVHTSGLGGFFESNMWPRPRHCARRIEGKEVMHPAERTWATKWISHEYRLEVRPILKSGSMTINRLLTCLPGNWTEVPSSRRTDYQVVVIVRPVVERFASAMMEVMARVFTGHCPEGACTMERDHLNETIARETIETVEWLTLAQQIFQPQEDAELPTMEELVLSAAQDASCDLHYYASEHFLTQTRLLVQGPDPTAEPLTVW